MLLEFDGTFVIAQISFIIFMVIMYFILLKPVGAIMYRRQKFMRKNELSAKKSAELAQEIEQKQEEKVKVAQKKASMLLSGVSTLLNAQRDNAVENAQQRGKTRLELVKKSLESQSESVQKELEPEVNEIAGIIASKVLNREIKIEQSGEVHHD